MSDDLPDLSALTGIDGLDALPGLSPSYATNDRGEYCGRLYTAPVPGGKRLQACALYFDDGESVIISYRPVPSLFAYERKRVAIRGALSNPALTHPERQSVYGWHLEVTSIRLLEGEQPYDPPPTELLPPVRVDRLADLRACPDRYARLVGTFLGGAELSSWRGQLRLGLLDGEVDIPSLRFSGPSGRCFRQLLDESSSASPLVTVTVSIAGERLSGLSIALGDCTP